MAKPRKETRFGAFGVSTPSSAPAHDRRRFLRPLPHAGDKCRCGSCDRIRSENAAARRSVNWPDDYPPSFYSRSNRTSFYGAGDRPSGGRPIRRPARPAVRRAERKRQALWGDGDW